MKKIFTLILLITILILQGCQKEYSMELMSDIADILSVEIVDVTDIYQPTEITVLKVLTTEEYQNLLNELDTITFKRFLFGDPADPSGICVRIKYMNNDFEVFDSRGHIQYSAEKQSWSWGFLYCDENVYLDLIHNYYEE